MSEPKNADATKPLVVEHKVRRKSGVATGASVVAHLTKVRSVTAEGMAAHLNLDRAYVHRVLNALVAEGVLAMRKVHKPGSPDVNVYKLKSTRDRGSST